MNDFVWTRIVPLRGLLSVCCAPWLAALVVGLALVLAAPLPTLAQSKVGTTAASFLEIGVGARSLAMGEASAAAAEDVTAMYWNPAGLVRGGSAVTFQYTEWFAETALQYAGGTVDLGANGSIGVQAYVMDSGEMEVTTLEFEDGLGETFRVRDLSLGLSYARYLTTTFALGGTFKYIRSSIWRMSSSAVALDLGVQYTTPFDGVRLGFSISNFGGEMELEGDNVTERIDLDPTTAGDNDGILANLDTRSWDLPLIFRIGVAYDVLQTANTRVLVTSDALYPNNNNPYVNLGTEIGYRDFFFVRGGYSNLFLTDPYGQGHLRLGFGLRAADTIQVDYAFADRGDLGRVNTIGAMVRF